MDSIGIAIIWFDFLKTRFINSGNKQVIKENEEALIPNLKREIKSEFTNDIEALCKYDPELKTWIDTLVRCDKSYELTIGLKDIFIICPRTRQRTERYNKLCSYVSETFNVVLNIKSQQETA